MIRALLALSLIVPLAGCFGLEEKDEEEEDDDEGGETEGWGSGGDASDGTDGGSGGGGEVPAGRSLSGEMDVLYEGGEPIGTWLIEGETVECDGCDFAFDAWFNGPSEFERTISFIGSGSYEYVYTNYGEYWGVGERGGGQATWYGYNHSYLYAYSGSVSF